MLISNWPTVLRKAWSVRFAVAATMFTGIEFAVPFLDGYVNVPPKIFAAFAGLASAAAFISRLMAQKGISEDASK